MFEHKFYFSNFLKIVHPFLLALKKWFACERIKYCYYHYFINILIPSTNNRIM